MLKKNTSLALNLVIAALGMLALAYASVPLYRIFCQATGYGGTTQQGSYQNGKIFDREVTVTFNADIDPGLPWEFAPGEKSVRVKIGQQVLTHFVAHNLSNKPITGHATYNVVPFTVGAYFVKIECFCFKEQTLAPGQRVDMPVLFYIEPSFMDDPEMKDVTTITLSYTFFPVKKGR
jgi:cytochrome c oxidase assembly protein subunit 11